MSPELLLLCMLTDLALSSSCTSGQQRSVLPLFLRDSVSEWGGGGGALNFLFRSTSDGALARIAAGRSGWTRCCYWGFGDVGELERHEAYKDRWGKTRTDFVQ